MTLAGEKEKGFKCERLYLFVAGAFQDMQKPTMNKTKPWTAPEDGPLGKASKSIAVRGIADAELVCARIILPEFGRRVESKVYLPSYHQIGSQRNYPSKTGL